MLAKLTLTMGRRRVEATLEDDFTWTCEDRVTESFLNAAFGPDATGTAPEANAGASLARRAAAAVGDAGWDVQLQMAEAEQNAA